MQVYGSNVSIVHVAGGQAFIEGTIESVYISSGGQLIASAGGLVSRSFVSSGGRQIVCSNTSAVETTVLDGGTLLVDDYGKASSFQVSSGGRAYILTLSEAEDIRIREGGVMYVGMGGSATDITIRGAVHAATGADLKDVAIGQGGTLYLYGGAILDGVINVNGTVIIDDVVHNYGLLNFQVGGASSDTAMLNDYSLLNGKDLSITVDPTLYDSGSYVIAGGAASFSDSVAVYGTDGAELCTLSAGASEKCGDYRYTLSVKNDELIFSYQDEAVILMTGGDLNGDGRADVVMTIDQSAHPADGATGAWLIQENQTPVWGDLSQRNSGWEIFGMGWTSADKPTNDVYVRNSDNVIGAWTTDDDGNVNGWLTIGSFDPDAQIVGLGDFNGNGQTDLLLRAANGAVGCYFTNGQGWNYFQSLGDEWKLSAIGDLNGDGRDDVVLAHDAGFAGCWLTQADGTPMWAGLDMLANGFEIVGAGDFDGDGTDDVLLKNGSYYGAWLVQNGNAVGWLGIGDLGDAAVEQIADFDGDGVDDLRIRTAAGDLGALLVMGEDSLDWHYYGSVGEEWKTGLAALG
jgi:autotransporter passenger strand-loop-strand repeat protein